MVTPEVLHVCLYDNPLRYCKDVSMVAPHGTTRTRGDGCASRKCYCGEGMARRGGLVALARQREVARL